MLNRRNIASLFSLIKKNKIPYKDQWETRDFIYKNTNKIPYHRVEYIQKNKYQIIEKYNYNIPYQEQWENKDFNSTPF